MYTITEKVFKTNENILQLNEGIPWSIMTNICCWAEILLINYYEKGNFSNDNKRKYISCP